MEHRLLLCVCVCVVHSDLHGYREVCLGLGREEDVHSLLLEGLVPGGRGSHLDDVQLQVCSTT